MQPLKTRSWNIFGMMKKCGVDSLSSWGVAIACTIVNFLVMGSSMSNAVLFVSYMETFGISRKQAAWPYSLWHSFLCVGGPIAGFFSQHFSIRTIVTCGTAAIALGACLCFFANSILYITICMGLLQGLGSAMPVILNPVSINQHFLESRGMASGLIHAGSISGRIVFPLLYAYFLTEYGLRGSYLLVGGILLHCQIATFFYKPPPVDCISNPFKNHQNAKKQRLEGTNSPTETTKVAFSKLPYILIPNVQNDCMEKCASTDREYLKLVSTPETELSADKNFLQINDKTLLKEKSLEISKPLTTYIFSKVTYDMQKSSKISVRKAFSNYMSTLVIALMNPTYLILTLSFALFLVCTVLFSTVYIDLATDRGISKHEAVFLMSLSALVEMVGRIFWGWFSDKGILSRKNMLVFNLLGLSITFGLFPLSSNYAMFLALTVLRSLITDAHMLINLPIVMGESLGIERLPVALGFTRFVTGVFGFVRPPILGYFRDTRGSYDLLFLTMSAILAGAASLWILESFIYKRTMKRSNSQEEKC